MPRLGNSSTNMTAGSVTNRNGELKLHWSFRYEFDWPANPPAAAAQGSVARRGGYADDLAAVLDKALAYAG